jgi:hypothetical protein
MLMQASAMRKVLSALAGMSAKALLFFLVTLRGVKGLP